MATPFCGYVETEGKKPKGSWKDPATWLTLEEAQGCGSFSGVIGEGFVLLDFDDLDQSEKAMDIVEANALDCMSVITTRGRHFYFRSGTVAKCGTDVALACGLRADIKVGGKGLGCLKADGKAREVDWDGGEYQELPAYFRPVKACPDFASMGDGDGRNQELFAYILALLKAGFTKDEVRETLRVINAHTLAKPLPDRELDTIMRDGAFPEEEAFYAEDRFQHAAFGDFLIREYNIISINNNLHIYRDGVYVPDECDIERRMLDHIKTLKKHDRSETMSYIGLAAPQRQICGNANLIAFENCLYDLERRATAEFSPDIVITNKIPWEWNPEAYSAAVDGVLANISCGDDEIRALLEECIGYCFYRDNEMGKAFILVGDGSNGKSTFLDMIEHVLGDSNRCALSLGELRGKFSVAEMFGKLANVGDDIGNDFLQGEEVSQFKKIVTGSTIKAERKGQDPFSFKPYVKLLFSANEIPRMKDRSYGLMRRLMIIPFNARFDKAKGDFNRYVKRDLRSREAMEYCIVLGVAGLHRVLDNDGFTECAAVAEAVRAYETDNNPILAFIEEAGECIAGRTSREVYLRYSAWCAENGLNELSQQVFSREICKRCGFAMRRMRVDGSRVNVFEEQ